MVVNSQCRALASLASNCDVKTIVSPVLLKSFPCVFCLARVERALPQEVFALLNVLRVAFISEFRLAVLTDEFMLVQHVHECSTRFPVSVGVAAVGAIRLLLDPLTNAHAAVKFLAFLALPDGRTHDKGAYGAFKVFGNILGIDRLLGAKLRQVVQQLVQA
jgi:hypothetical protein